MKHLYMFDFDGTLVDSLDAFYDCVASLSLEFGIDALQDKEVFLSMFDGNMAQGMFALGFTPEQLPDYLSRLELMLVEKLSEVTFFPQLLETVQSLCKNHTVYIITSNASRVVESFIQLNGLEGIAEVLGADKGTSKVDKIKRTCSSIKYERAFYVGDTLGDMLEGREAGVESVAVPWGWHSVDKMKQAKPDHILSNAKDLLAL